MLNKNHVEDKKLVPKNAIIIYEQNNSYYLENRRIAKTKRGFEMMEGAPLKKETLSTIMETIETTGQEKIYCKGIFPNKLLYFDNNYNNEVIIWKLNSSWRNLSFSESLGIKDGQFLLPTLVFEVRNGNLSIYATKTENVNKRTELYKAPFHNIYSENNVCMGSAKVKQSKEVNEIMKAYEDGFFMSKFTHLQSNGSTIKGNLNTYLSKTDKIEKKVLLKINKKLEELL